LAGEGTDPYVGHIGKQHQENEMKIEVVFPSWLEKTILAGLRAAHPYEEVAYDIVNVSNNHDKIGSGLIGELPKPTGEIEFLGQLRERFNLKVIRHTPLLDRPIKRVALCGGAGSFLVPKALGAGADIYVTADMKYHEFFDANGRMVIADIGHFESEQFTIDLLAEILEQKFPNFAVLKTKVLTNPVQYFVG
jgi:putative NIF3 family GTP cyclohydrolase 1 type 2